MSTATPHPPIAPRRAAHQPDPIMQALWAVKAQINKDCDYSIDKVFEMARASRLAREQRALGI